MCYIIVSHMKTASIRELKHDTNTVLGWVAAGESVEVQRRGARVAVLSPQARMKRIVMPDFLARMRTAYGDKVLSTTGTELVTESRGDR